MTNISFIVCRPLRLFAMFLATTLLIFCVHASAQQTPGSLSPSIGMSGTYRSATKVLPGTLVSLVLPGDRDDQSNEVIPAVSANRDRMLGVAIESPSTAMVGDEAVELEVYPVEVATSGTVWLTVSDINGVIRAGDSLTASPIEGGAMRATSSGKVIATALSDFSVNVDGATTTTITDKNGERQTIRIGRILVTIAVADYAPKVGSDSTGFIGSITAILDRLGADEVSRGQTISAAIIGLIAVLVIIVLMFAVVGNSVRAIGRNPLARRSIAGALIFAVTTSLAVLLVAAGAIFIVLR